MADNLHPIVPDHFPQELQRYIFEVAARKFPSTGIQLVRVAQHVRAWIEPILYECIIVRNEECCLKLLETLATRPELFLSNTRQIALVTDTVTLKEAKTLLAACSHGTKEFSVWGGQRNPTIFLPYIRSHSVERLALHSHHASELSIPPSILSTLTHLMMLDGPYSWSFLRQAAHEVREAEVIHEAHSPPPLSRSPPSATVSPTPVKPYFQTLTHFGVCSQNWGSAQPILRVAENLKYFAVIVAPKCTARSAATIEQRIRELGDPRVVLVEYDHTVENWETAARGGRDIWDLVENMVEDRKKNPNWATGSQRPRGWSFSANA